MSLLQKAENQSAYLKAGILGFVAGGKTWTASEEKTVWRLAQHQTSVRHCQFCAAKFIRYEIVFPMNEACNGCREEIKQKLNPPHIP